MRQFLSNLWEKHSEKMLAGAVALAPQPGDLLLTKFLPIPGDLVGRGVAATLLCGIISLAAAGLIVGWAKQRFQRYTFRWICVGSMVVALIVTACWYNSFFWVEDKWKLTDDPAHERRLYWFWEPLTYSLTFASLAAFIVFGY